MTGAKARALRAERLKLLDSIRRLMGWTLDDWSQQTRRQISIPGLWYLVSGKNVPSVATLAMLERTFPKSLQPFIANRDALSAFAEVAQLMCEAEASLTALRLSWKRAVMLSLRALLTAGRVGQTIAQSEPSKINDDPKSLALVVIRTAYEIAAATMDRASIQLVQFMLVAGELAAEQAGLSLNIEDIPRLVEIQKALVAAETWTKHRPSKEFLSTTEPKEAIAMLEEALPPDLVAPLKDVVGSADVVTGFHAVMLDAAVHRTRETSMQDAKDVSVAPSLGEVLDTLGASARSTSPSPGPGARTG
jgi:hypothetical protein